jgi:hypothetical protein
MNLDNILQALAGLNVPGDPGLPPTAGKSAKPRRTWLSPVPPVPPVEKSKKGLANGEDLPAPCQDCPSCEILTFGCREIAGCVQKLSAGPWREEWRRLDSLTHCPKQKPTIH